MQFSELKAKATLAAMAAGAALAGGGEAAAAGFAVNEISVERLGRANAGAAADKGAGALWFNPASIARSGREISLGATNRDHRVDFTDNGSTITLPVPPAGLTVPIGGRSSISDGAEDLVALYAAGVMPIGDRFALGLSMTKPFVLKTELGADAWSRYDTIRSQIDVTDVQLTGAFQATDWLDIGVGVSAQHNDAYLDQAWPNLAPGAPDAISRLKADGWNWGWTVGAQAHFETISLGASYRSKVEQELDGTLALSGLVAPLDAFNFTAPAKATFTLPWSFTVGASWAVTPALTLSGQVERAGWGEYDVITVNFGQTAVIPQNFDDVTSVAIGAEYALNEMWSLRAGVRTDPTPTPDTLREPGVWDADSRLWAVGATVNISEGLRLHGALAWTDFDDAILTDNDVFYAGSPAQTTARSRGVVSGDGISAGLGLDFRF
ncbi:OmpP1/FadL family transporter [Phenylobacterium sp.]|uniref:OmpP1/FadL family transporter n=1 Tax=Phenylobacterium sp. TaxID=1871053 RepID=UPI002F94C540